MSSRARTVLVRCSPDFRLSDPLFGVTAMQAYAIDAYKAPLTPVSLDPLKAAA